VTPVALSQTPAAGSKRIRSADVDARVFPFGCPDSVAAALVLATALVVAIVFLWQFRESCPPF